MYITPKQVFEKVDFSLSETPEKPFPGQILTSLYHPIRAHVAPTDSNYIRSGEFTKKCSLGAQFL